MIMSNLHQSVSKLPAPRSRLPSRQPLSKITTNVAPASKRTHDGAHLITGPPKRLKQENRVSALRKQAARRSVGNALKISRIKEKKQSSGLIRNIPNKTVSIKSNNTIKRATTITKNKPRSIPDRKCATSANSSISSAGSAATVPKKTKRKPWDLKGQIADLKEELAASKQKVQIKHTIAQENEATLEGILQRLEALESEKKSIVEERSALSGDLAGYRQQVDEKTKKILELENQCEDLSRQLRSSRQMCDDMDLDLRKLKREKSDLEDRLHKMDADHKALQSTCEDQQETIRKLNEELSSSNRECERLRTQSEAMEEDRRKLLNVVQELKGNIRVFCRVRPLLKEEEKEFGHIEHIEFTGNDKKSLVILNDADKPATYTFDRVFNTQATQENVFSEVHQLVESALDGYNVCIFAYGQTGAGKTYTMEGCGGLDTPTSGIIPRSMKLMFKKCEEKQKFGWEYKLAVQHVEIYQETLLDLLQPGDDSNKLEIKTVTGGGKQKVWVKNLSEHPVSSFSQIKSLLEGAKSKRVTASTAANSRSSRSHSVFTLKISGKNCSTQEEIEACLNLIDLAGSERVAETGSSGMRLKEAKKINGSLTQLSNVISSLANKDSHIPYRNSKLTFLLMDSLGGNSKTLMLVNVNPTRRSTSETINTLRFATTVNKCNIGTAQKVIKF